MIRRTRSGPSTSTGRRSALLWRRAKRKMDRLARDLDAVIFDVGNTLFYLDYARLVALLARHAIVPATLSSEAAATAERRARPALSRYLEENAASTEDPGSFRRYLVLALEQAGIVADDGAVD